MKIIHDGTKVLNETICGYDPKKYPRLNKHGKPLPGHGYYALKGAELKAYQKEQESGSKVLEKQWQEALAKRDELLSAINTDDSSLTKKKKDALEKYRKSLENLENDFDNPSEIVWPDAP